MANIGHWYTNIITDRESGLEVTFVSIPAGVLANPEVLKEPDTVLSRLGLINYRQVGADGDPSTLEYLVQSCLLTDELAEEPEVTQAAGYIDSIVGQQTDIAGFAHQIVLEELVPIEQSPLELASLATLFSKAKGAAPGVLGAYIGLVAAGPYPLLALVTAPFGIVLVGASFPVAEALGAALAVRLRILIGVKDARRASRRRNRSIAAPLEESLMSKHESGHEKLPLER